MTITLGNSYHITTSSENAIFLFAAIFFSIAGILFLYASVTRKEWFFYPEKYPSILWLLNQNFVIKEIFGESGVFLYGISVGSLFVIIPWLVYWKVTK